MNEVPAAYNVRTQEISHQKRIEKQLIKSQFADDPIAAFGTAYSTRYLLPGGVFFCFFVPANDSILCTHSMA